MVQNNQDIRKAIKEAGLRQWMVADRYGVCEAHFSRLLRKELPTDKKNEIFQVIKELNREMQIAT